MRIDGVDVGAEDSPYFIAEAGVNHNGDLEMAEKLVDVATRAGADAVKFQTFDPDRLVTRDAETSSYQQETQDVGSQYELLEALQLDRSAHERLMDYCDDRDITLLSTPFDARSAELLADLGVPAIKLGSGELTNHPLLQRVAKLGLPMIVSTGMGTMDEVKAADHVLRSAAPDCDVVYLHCTSSYPAEVEDVNLRAMEAMATSLNAPVGYSDHTVLPEMPAFAVAAGACVVEKHFTLDSTLPGPDHEASLEPDELERAVELVEAASCARGRPEKEPVAAELENRTKVRKSLHAATDLEAGTTLRESDVDVLRPAEGVSPDEFEAVLGATVTEPIAEGEPIRRELIERE